MVEITDPDKLPKMCVFAQSLVLPRIERIEADLSQSGKDLDSEHSKLRLMETNVQGVMLVQEQHKKRIERLEVLVDTQAAEANRMAAALTSLSLRIDAMWDRLGNIDTNFASFIARFEKHSQDVLAQHQTRMRWNITLWGLIGSLVGFVALAHQAASGESLIATMKSFLGM